MSPKLRKSVLFCMAACIITGSTLTLLADTKQSTDTSNTQTMTQVTPTLSHNQPTTPTATNAKGYIPPNNKSETIYVNLDHYGIPTETQVVNGYRIDGDTKIVDYGKYTNIINLTDYTKPSINEDQITWELKDDVANFYYQGTLDQIDLPWNFTIRYKLNGVETKAEDLAGASGMIETIIDVKPNDKVSDYLKNNFFLQLSTSYDMGKCLSVEAPDGVDVTLGATKSITFMAMPGEEASFHLYVGSDSYESTGFNVVIAPLQMSALDEVTELNDAKDRMENAFDAASESLDIILDSTSEIKTGLGELNQGIASIQSSLKAIRSDDAAMDEKVEALLANSEALSQSLETLTPHLENSQQFVSDFNTCGNTLVSDLKELSPLLDETKASLAAVQADLTGLKDVIEKLDKTSKKLDNTLEPLKLYLKQLSVDMGTLENSLQNLSSGLDSSESSLHSASNSLSDLSSQLGSITSSLTPEQMLQIGNLVNSGVHSGVLTPEQAQLLQNLDGADLSRISSLLDTTGSLAGDSTNVLSALSKVSTDVANMSSALVNITNSIQEVNSTLNSNTDTFTFTLDDLSSLLDQLSRSSDIASMMITDLEQTQNTVNEYIPGLVSFLQDSSTLITNTSGVTNSATDLGAQLHSTVTSNRQHTYDSIDQTLSASIHTFENIINSLGQTNDLKKNKDIIKNTIDDEWNKIDEDFNLLNYDPDAIPVSLVSDKNTNVDSIQIILRTPEITVDKKAEIKAAKAEQKEEGVWDRVKNIFANIF